MTNLELIDKLSRVHALGAEEWTALITAASPEERQYAADAARGVAQSIYGKKVFYRGIVEFTNICKNNCLYCGIRRGDAGIERYRLTPEQILGCCESGYRNGFRTFVLQGGEDPYFTDERLCAVVAAIHAAYPDCAVTLSVGERTRESYQKLYESGATRYLLRHETADEGHYGRLHPPEMSWSHRMNCLRELKEIGYQTGCGMMVGSPYQTPECLVKDMVFMGAFKPEMVGIGPFIPHHGTPFRDFATGSVDLTIFLLSLTRLMLPTVLLPATTALGTAAQDGRQRGILAGANVIMPNLSPVSVRKNYMLYDHKKITGDDAGESVRLLRSHMAQIGYELVSARGDCAGFDAADGKGTDK